MKSERRGPPARRNSVVGVNQLQQLVNNSVKDVEDDLRFRPDRDKFKQSRELTKESSLDGSSGSLQRCSYWEAYGVAMIQIVSHSDGHLQMLDQELVAEGYEVRTAHSMSGACESDYCTHCYADVVIIDGGLPGKEDMLLKTIKAFFRKSQTIVLGRMDDRGQPTGLTIANCFRNGVKDFMWYPIVADSDELLARVEKLLSSRHRGALLDTELKELNKRTEDYERMMRMRTMMQEPKVQDSSTEGSPGVTGLTATLSKSLGPNTGMGSISEEEMMG